MAGRLGNALEVFDKYAYRGRTLVETQMVEEFNSASGGAVVMQGGMTGDFEDQAGWQKLSTLVTNLNLGATVADETPTPLTQYNERAVHIAQGSKSVSFEPLRLSWIGLNPRVAGATVGQQVGRGMVKNKVNNGIQALVTCMNNLPATTTNNQGTTAADANNIGLDMLLQARGKLGDHFRKLKTWVMHSAAWNRFTRKNVKDFTELFVYEDLAVFRDPLGTRFIITDDPALKYTHSSQDKYRTIGLVEGALRFYDSGQLITNVDNSNRSLIQTTLKTQSSFGMRVRGFSWNSATKYPTLVQIGTSSNWTATANIEVSDGPGVLLLHQASA